MMYYCSAQNLTENSSHVISYTRTHWSFHIWYNHRALFRLPTRFVSFLVCTLLHFAYLFAHAKRALRPTALKGDAMCANMYPTRNNKIVRPVV